MSRRRRTRLQTIGEINLTPMLDFSLTLLTVFLMTYPLLEQGVRINLPQGKADDLKPEQARTVNVRLDGALFLDNEPVTETQMAYELAEAGRANPDLIVYVRADRDLKYSRVMEVMRLLHEAGLRQVALVSQAE